MKNCFIYRDFHDNVTDRMRVGIADLTNEGEMIPRTMTITRINIPSEYRGQGHGSRFLKRITDAADAEGVGLSLEVMPSGPLGFDDLVAWYTRHGFVGYEDYMGVMVRWPKESADLAATQ